MCASHGGQRGLTDGVISSKISGAQRMRAWVNWIHDECMRVRHALRTARTRNPPRAHPPGVIPPMISMKPRGTPASFLTVEGSCRPERWGQSSNRCNEELAARVVSPVDIWNFTMTLPRPVHFSFFSLFLFLSFFFFFFYKNCKVRISGDVQRWN